MKRIIIVCLLGISGLLSQAKAIGSVPPSIHIVNSTIEGWVFVVNSDETSGTISEIKIYDGNQKLVAETSCTSYDCSIDLTGLAPGTYTAKVYTQYSYYTTNISFK